jgi:hypothetical protein
MKRTEPIFRSGPRSGGVLFCSKEIGWPALPEAVVRVVFSEVAFGYERRSSTPRGSPLFSFKSGLPITPGKTVHLSPQDRSKKSTKEYMRNGCVWKNASGSRQSARYCDGDRTQRSR